MPETFGPTGSSDAFDAFLARLLAAQLAPMEGGMNASGKMRVGYFTQYQVEELSTDDTPLVAAALARDLPLPGRHNRGNLCAVLAALEALGLDAVALAALGPVVAAAAAGWVDAVVGGGGLVDVDDQV